MLKRNAMRAASQETPTEAKRLTGTHERATQVERTRGGNENSGNTSARKA